jgi:hypothetical protein
MNKFKKMVFLKNDEIITYENSVNISNQLWINTQSIPIFLNNFKSILKHETLIGFARKKWAVYVKILITQDSISFLYNTYGNLPNTFTEIIKQATIIKLRTDESFDQINKIKHHFISMKNMIISRISSNIKINGKYLKHKSHKQPKFKYSTIPQELSKSKSDLSKEALKMKCISSRHFLYKIQSTFYAKIQNDYTQSNLSTNINDTVLYNNIFENKSNNNIFENESNNNIFENESNNNIFENESNNLVSNNELDNNVSVNESNNNVFNNELYNNVSNNESNNNTSNNESNNTGSDNESLEFVTISPKKEKSSIKKLINLFNAMN